MPPCPTTSRNHVMLISYVNIHQVSPSRTLEEKLRGRILVLVIGPKNGPRYGPWIWKVCKARSTIVSKQPTSAEQQPPAPDQYQRPPEQDPGAPDQHPGPPANAECRGMRAECKPRNRRIPRNGTECRRQLRNAIRALENYKVYNYRTRMEWWPGACGSSHCTGGKGGTCVARW